MQLHCPTCRAEILAEDVNLGRALAKCRACNAVFDFSDQFGVNHGAAASVNHGAGLAPVNHGAGSALQRRRPPVPVPASITVVEDPAPLDEPGYRDAPHGGGAVTIVRRWRTVAAAGTALFCVFWNGFLVFWYRITADAPLIFRLFPLIHVTVGVVMTYRTLAALLNTTRITITDDAVTIRHGPVPWPGNRRIPSADLEQLFVEEQVTQQKNGASRSYHLSAVMKDGAKQRLLSGLPEPDQALFLEQRIEERLRIADTEVGGEYPR
ncbi:MAG: hypothetical protein QM820_59925 [Minicystis sp.]